MKGMLEMPVEDEARMGIKENLWAYKTPGTYVYDVEFWLGDWDIVSKVLNKMFVDCYYPGKGESY